MNYTARRRVRVAVCAAVATLTFVCVLMVSVELVPMGGDSTVDAFHAVNSACAIADTVTGARPNNNVVHPVVASRSDTVLAASVGVATIPLAASATSPPQLEFSPLRT